VRGETVPYISVPEELPGILGLLAFKPETAATVGAFTQQLLRGPSSLTPGEREIIAAVVSRRMSRVRTSVMGKSWAVMGNNPPENAANPGSCRG
jgi:alkylhydroperoxidase family enzyme